jgi:hypothetical protein
MDVDRHGLVTTQQLEDQGHSFKDIERLVRQEALTRLHRGVYLVAPARLTVDAESAAAVMALGDGATLTLESALAHWHLRLRPAGPIHVNAPTTAGRATRKGLTPHRARIPESDIVEERGVRTTTPTRTLLDIASRQPEYALFRALEQAERLLLHIERPRLDACKRLRRPLALFDALGPCTRSDAEAMFLFVCLDHGIALPRVNQDIDDEEADFHWPIAHLVVEVDGYEFHHDKRPFHRDRHKALVFRRAGFEVIRFSAIQVARRAHTVAETVLLARPVLRE